MKAPKEIRQLFNRMRKWDAKRHKKRNGVLSWFDDPFIDITVGKSARVNKRQRTPLGCQNDDSE